MNLFTDCPVPAEFSAIPKQACNFKIGQVVKFAIGRIGATLFDGTTNVITSKTAWDAAIAAGDLVVSNYVNGFTASSTDLITDGGDQNINRIPEIVDISNAEVTFNPRGMSPEVRVAMQKLTQFSHIQPGVSEIGIMFFNENGEVVHDEDNYLIPVYNFFVGDSDINPERGRTNTSTGKFMLLGGWSNNLKISKPAFNILAAYPAVVTP